MRNSLKTPATHKKNALSSQNLFSEDEEPAPAQTRECKQAIGNSP